MFPPGDLCQIRPLTCSLMLLDTLDLSRFVTRLGEVFAEPLHRIAEVAWAPGPWTET